MRALILVLISAALLAVPAAASAAETGPCIPGQSRPICVIWTGKVTFVGDGDTLYIRVNGVGVRRVRISGIQAMEQTRYAEHARDRRGECHALEATAYLARLIKRAHGRVRLTAQDPRSTSRGRLRRSVAVRLHGRWLDLGRAQITHGHALWLPNGVEYAWNGEYSVLAERTAAKGRNLWNPNYCGAGPPANVRLWVNWDAEGVDRSNVNGEWIRIKNLDTTGPLPLGGWWVRDSDLRRYRLPEGTSVPPGGTITIHVGRGANTAGDLFWGLRKPAFDNVTDDDLQIGDGGYLFDPQGDLRAYMMYPCRTRCTDPLKGKVDVQAAPRRHDEFVTVRNVSDVPLDLEGYQLRSSFHSYDFGPESVLQPGESLRLDVEGSAAEDTPFEKHWGFDEPILRNEGDAVAIRTFSDITLTCYSWGDGSCSAGAGAGA
jgi:endonuclease YncB( thermonuclease family)